MMRSWLQPKRRSERMAKRRKLTAPSAAEISALEQGFAAKPSPASSALMPPIAQVAAEAAALTPSPSLTAEMRAEAAKDKRDAERLRQAEAEGLILLEIPTEDIVADELTRDRMVMDAEAMDELKASISVSGLRLPIEVFEIAEPGDGPRFGLLSGFRRLAAIRVICEVEQLSGLSVPSAPRARSACACISRS